MTREQRAQLRETHVAGWTPRMSVQIEVRTLAALLDQCDALEEIVASFPALEARLTTLEEAVCSMRSSA